MTLSISVLGPPDIEVDGLPLDVDTRKATALMVYLVVESGEHPRDRLVDLLWPDTDVDRARSSLRRTLSTLRSALGGRWVEADRSFVTLDRTGVEFDLGRFETLADDLHGHDAYSSCPRCIGVLTEAAALCRGPFLDGFYLRDAPPFESWVTTNTRHIDRRADLVFERLANAHAASGDYQAAASSASRRITLDPLREDAHRQLMLLHAWDGDRSAAIDTYRHLVATLDTELGVPPLDETTELYEAILEEDLPPAPAPPRRPIAAPSEKTPALPLVGRDDLLATAFGVLGEPGGIVVVEGSLGMGSTRFLEEVVSQARVSGSRVLQAGGSATGTGVPYGVIHDALYEITGDDALAALPDNILVEASRLFPGLSSEQPPPAEAAGRTRFLDAMSRVVGALERPILVVDDVDYCDASSAELISFLAARAKRIGLAIVVASAPDQARPAGAVETMLSDLAGRGSVLTLTPLESSDVATLVEAARSAADPVVLTEQSGGIPLFVVESLRAVDSGHDPDRIRRVLTDRLAEISGAAQQVLDAIAVLGTAATPGLVAEVSGRSGDETDVAIDDLVRRGLITESADGAVAIGHSHLAEAVSVRHTAARRRSLNRRAARALESRRGVGAEASRVAHHHRAAGDDASSAEWYTLAGDEAAAVFAHREAMSHYESALASEHADRALLHRSIAHCAMLDGQYDRAIAGYEAAMSAGDTDPALEHRLGEVYRRLRRWDLAAAHYERVDTAETETELAAIASADRGFVEHQRGDRTAAESWVSRALQLAADSGSPRAVARAENVAGVIAATTAERMNHLEAALEHAHEPAERMAVLNNLAATATASAEAVALAREALELAVQLGDRHLMAVLHNTLADALHRAGESEASMEALTEAVSLFTTVTADASSVWTPEVWLLTEW